MNVAAMRFKISTTPDAMVGESALPYFSFSTLHSQSVGIASFDELHRTLQGYIRRWCQQQVDVFGHEDESMQFKLRLPSITVKRLQEQSCVRLYGKEPASLPG